MIVFPNAKINIGLHVVSKRPDGYHNLETLFYPVTLSDVLEMAETGKTEITFSGLPVDGVPQENLVLKAYRLVKVDFNLPPVQFHLHKVIPIGAGLGGGSSDAAFTLKMLNTYFKLNLSRDRLKDYAVRLGADCVFFLENKPVFAEGIGDVLKPIDLDISQYEIVLIKPEVSVSTKHAYENIKPFKPEFYLTELSAFPVENWKNLVINDFEKSIFLQFPEIKRWKEILYESGAIYASMSGSGSALYGIFRQIPKDLDDKIPASFILTQKYQIIKVV